MSNIEQQLDNLTDELIDNIIRTPHEEILKEVKEDHGDTDYEAKKFRAILKKAKENIDKRKGQSK